MFACNICQRFGFTSKHSVNQHQYSFHPKGKQLAKRSEKVCPFCLMVFDTLEQLKRHFKDCFYDMEDDDLPPEIIQELISRPIEILLTYIIAKYVLKVQGH